MGVTLVADVENNFIFREVKYIVQRDGQLYHPEVGGEMSAVLKNGRNYPAAYVFA